MVQIMDRDSLRSLVRRRPFKPFRLFVSDGAGYDVRHPDLIMTSQTEAVIGLPPVTNPTPDAVERFAWIDLDHITRVEPLDAPAGAGSS